MVRANVLRARERAQIAHDACLENVTRPANVARRREINPALNLDVLGAGAVAAAAVTAMLCFGKNTVQLSTNMPAVLHVLDLIDMRAAWREIVDEADLHALFNQGFAGKFGFDFWGAQAAHHASARSADALAHASNVLREWLPREGKSLDDRVCRGNVDGLPIDWDPDELLSHTAQHMLFCSGRLARCEAMPACSTRIVAAPFRPASIMRLRRAT